MNDNIEIPSICCDNQLVADSEVHIIKLRMLSVIENMCHLGFVDFDLPKDFMVPFILVQSGGVQDYEYKGRFGLCGISQKNMIDINKISNGAFYYVKSIEDVKRYSLSIGMYYLSYLMQNNVNEYNIVDLKAVTKVFFDSNEKLYRLAGVNGYLSIYKNLWNT